MTPCDRARLGHARVTVHLVEITTLIFVVIRDLGLGPTIIRYAIKKWRYEFCINVELTILKHTLREAMHVTMWTFQ